MRASIDHTGLVGSNKPPEVKAGDRVLVTFEGDVTETSSVDFWPITPEGLSAPTLWIRPDLGVYPKIERIEPPLKVGDRVRYLSNPKSTTGVIVAFDGPLSVVRFEPSHPLSQTYYDAVRTGLLERLP